MKSKKNQYLFLSTLPGYIINMFLLFALLLTVNRVNAQYSECVFKDTLLKIDFGTSVSRQDFNLRSLRDYQRDNGNCPGDGFYSYSTETSGCFNGDWITLTQDHTTNDVNGRMFFVNAAPEPAVFFTASLAGFKPSTNYEFGIWMMNLCKVNGGCSPLPPTILISLETTTGSRIASFRTGQIISKPDPSWKKYFALFTTPAEPGMLVLKMEDQTYGTCGNDFVMDDITFRECYKKEEEVVVKELKPEVKLPPKPVVTVKPEIESPKPILKKDTIGVKKIPGKEADRKPGQVTNIKPMNIPIPDVLLTRENPVIRKIETGAAEMTVELYDNGQIDGDTVSIYHNNQLIVSHAGLSEKPISFKIKIDAKEPHHELTMVADNLGSIPPNTSLMIIKANGKRYEIFISSSEQKNAKLVIDLKE